MNFRSSTEEDREFKTHAESEHPSNIRGETVTTTSCFVLEFDSFCEICFLRKSM